VSFLKRKNDVPVDFKLEGLDVNGTKERKVINLNQSEYANLPKGWFKGKLCLIRRILDFANKEFVIIITEAKDDV